jgi:hypothetical protein
LYGCVLNPVGARLAMSSTSRACFKMNGSGGDADVVVVVLMLSYL